MALSPAPPHQTVRSVFPNTAFQSSSSRGFRFRLAFRYSFHRSSRNYLEFIALPQSPFLPSFRNMMKVLPLPSLKVMLSLRCKRYYGQLRLPCRPSGTSFPYIHQLPSRQHRQGSPVFILVWLPLRVTPVTPEAHLSVLVVFVRIDAPVFPNVGEGRQLHCVFSRLHLGSLALRPAGLLGSLTEPLSGNLMLQVTLYTSLKLRGRTTELPRSDFNRQVIRFTRHTLLLFAETCSRKLLING